jgi:hypothetical protein
VTTTGGARDALLLETLGSRLLAYLCNVSVADVEVRFREGSHLPGDGENALAQLLPLAERIAQDQLNHPGLPVSFSTRLLGEVPSGSAHSVGNILRLAAGGGVDERTDDGSDPDSVKRLLFQLGRDSYPQLLLPAGEWPHPHLMFFNHPAQAELLAAVQADEQLSKLYPSEDPGLGHQGAMYTSLGSGGTIQSVMFGETVIGSAWELARMATSSAYLPDLYDSIDATVNVLRAAVAGDAVQVPAFIYFTGFTTGGRTIDTPWGALRPITETEREAAPSALEGRVSGSGAEGQSVTVSYAGEVVLTAQFPFWVRSSAWSPGDEFPEHPEPATMTGASALRRCTEGIQLAVLLAGDRPVGEWATARFAWQWIADPTTQGRAIGWADTRSSPGFMPHELSDEECEEVSRWATLIDSQWKSRIDIAIRRMLSAAQQRTDPADRLVDSVIALENLFGTIEGEPRFRVSSAMAWLLGGDAADRRSLQSEVKGLYDDRSKIVHGGTFDELSIAARSNRALELARASLRALLRDRPDVLRLQDGAARSLTLVLGTD